MDPLKKVENYQPPWPHCEECERIKNGPGPETVRGGTGN